MIMYDNAEQEKKDFIQEVVEELKNQFGDDYSIEVQEVKKNNDVVLTGLIIREEGINIAPTIYLERYLEMYQDGRSLEKIVEAIVSLYEEHKRKNNFDITQFTDWDNVKSKVCFKLINTEANKKLLEEIPSISYLDLSIVFYVKVEVEGITDFSSILIRNAHAKRWGVNAIELFEIAKNNTKKLLGVKIQNIGEIMANIIGQPELVGESIEEITETPMWILTNKSSINGSSLILYPEILEKISEKLGDEYYIIPSSIHEVLCVPSTSDEMDANAYSAHITSLIEEVNNNALSPEEKLSDTLYKYNRLDNSTSMA